MSLTSLASLIKILYMRIKSDLIYIIETIRYSVVEVAAAAEHIAQIKDRTSPGRGAAGAVIYLAVAAIKLSTPCVWILRQPGLSRPGPVTVHRIWIHLEPPLRAGEDKFRTIGDLLE